MPPKGKKRSLEEPDNDIPSPSHGTESSALSSPSKKSKKGVTRQCPVCFDDIPVRLLQTHADFELERVKEIAKRIPDDIEVDDSLDTPGAGPSSRRGAAIRARKSMNGNQTAASPAGRLSSISEAEKTIKILQRHRRARHAKTREFSKAVLDDLDRRHHEIGTTSQCPICQIQITSVRGGETLAEHVDRCLAETAASEAHRLEEMQTSLNHGIGEVYDMNGETRIRLTSLTGFAGTGFSVRNPNHADVDDDLDVEGADEDEFGEAQFDEADIIIPDSCSQTGEDDVAVDDIERDSPPSFLSRDVDVPGQPARGRTLRDLVAAGKVSSSRLKGALFDQGKAVKNYGIPDAIVPVPRSLGDLDAAIEVATISGDKDTLIAALRRKLEAADSQSSQTSATSVKPVQPSSVTCRVCLEPYSDPTCSVACWHVFCNSCWLRCLGTTKLCPICKHISLASNLRRVYL